MKMFGHKSKSLLALFFLGGLSETNPGAAVFFDTGGALGTQLSPGNVDIEGDGTADINFVSFGSNSGFLDALTPFGLTGDSGSGAAWVRSSSTDVAADGTGGNEIIAPFRGALAGSSDNWSKVHLSSGDGWVQWNMGATREIITPLSFVREGVGENLSAAQASAVPEPASVGLVFSMGALAFAGLRRLRSTVRRPQTARRAKGNSPPIHRWVGRTNR